jgi:GDPmannose 4,6-dehydratase
VVIDPTLLRPAEVEHLIGDATKARRILGWEPEVDFEQLMRMMVDADLELLKHEVSSRGVPADVTGSAPGLNPRQPR